MEETTWYDARGTSIAYVSQDGKTVYLWNGKAIAYLVDDKVYSWRGRHLGWFVDGVVHDGRGRRVGFTEATCPVDVAPSPAKKTKAKAGPRAARAGAQERPALSAAKSELVLGAFLQS